MLQRYLEPGTCWCDWTYEISVIFYHVSPFDETTRPRIFIRASIEHNGRFVGKVFDESSCIKVWGCLPPRN